MAVVNSPYVGISRGRLGEGVYYRAKGNTNLRSYNPSPQNRRTVNQQSQRSLFSSAVKFFSRGVQNLFVFAYEDKRTQESDYNAFMRYNAKLGMYFGPAQNSNPAYPAIGNWILTHGSLPTLRYETVNDYVSAVLPATTSNIEFATVAEVSQALIAGGSYQQGDIFTFLTIVTNALASSPSEPMTDYDDEPEWRIRQMILDTADTRTLASLELKAYGREGSQVVLQDYHDTFADSVVGGYAVIHSRIVAGSLKVSDSSLVLSSVGQMALVYGRSSTWRSIVMTAWDSEQLSILQGGAARRTAGSVTPTMVFDFTLPANVNTFTDNNITILGAYTLTEILDSLKFVSSDGDLGELMRDSDTAFVIVWDGDALLDGTYEVIDGNTFVHLERRSETPSAVVNSIYWDVQ